MTDDAIARSHAVASCAELSNKRFPQRWHGSPNPRSAASCSFMSIFETFSF